MKTFFFGDHVIIRTKLRHFLRLFWSSQNRKSVIFELAPGPRSALGAPAIMTHYIQFIFRKKFFELLSMLLSNYLLTIILKFVTIRIHNYYAIIYVMSSLCVVLSVACYCMFYALLFVALTLNCFGCRHWCWD